MKYFYIFLLCIWLSLYIKGIEGNIPDQVVQPHGIESINGSSVNMGCTSPFGRLDDVIVCMSKSYLLDGCSPAIDTSVSEWAFQLVTVRKTQTAEIPFDHVLLTFAFDEVVSLSTIEMDLFLCPLWGIGAPFISVYANVESNLVFTSNSLSTLPFVHYTPSQSSCNSLSTVTIILGDALKSSSFLTWHILVSSFAPLIDWVHVGEVRFLGTDIPNPGLCASSASSSGPSSDHRTSTITLKSSPTPSSSIFSHTTSSVTQVPSPVKFSTSYHTSLTINLSSSPVSVVGTGISSQITQIPTFTSTEIITPTISTSAVSKTSPVTITTISPMNLLISSDLARTVSSINSVIHQTSSHIKNQTTSPIKSDLHQTTVSTVSIDLPSKENTASAGDSIHRTIMPTLNTRVTSTGLELTTGEGQSTATLQHSPFVSVAEPNDKCGCIGCECSVSTELLTHIDIITLTLLAPLVITTIVVVVISVGVCMNRRKQPTKITKKNNSYIDIVPLQTTRMDVPEESEEFGVHKVKISSNFENGNVYEI